MRPSVRDVYHVYELSTDRARGECGEAGEFPCSVAECSEPRALTMSGRVAALFTRFPFAPAWQVITSLRNTHVSPVEAGFHTAGQDSVRSGTNSDMYRDVGQF